MLALGHTGITLGAAVLLSGAFIKNDFSPDKTRDNEDNVVVLSEDTRFIRRFSKIISKWLSSLAREIDIRILLIGSLLPDIIDKPLGILFLREEISNGRIYSHTLLFLIIITLAGVYLYRNRRKTWLLALSFGTFIHFILDQMWRNSKTLFWPFLGIAFQKTDVSEWIPDMLYSLHTNPAVYIPEIIGFIILTWFVIVLIKEKNVFTFIRKGYVY